MKQQKIQNMKKIATRIAPPHSQKFQTKAKEAATTQSCTLEQKVRNSFFLFRKKKKNERKIHALKNWEYFFSMNRKKKRNTKVQSFMIYCSFFNKKLYVLQFFLTYSQC